MSTTPPPVTIEPRGLRYLVEAPQSHVHGADRSFMAGVSTRTLYLMDLADLKAGGLTLSGADFVAMPGGDRVLVICDKVDTGIHRHPYRHRPPMSALERIVEGAR